jgi:DNA-binding NtrC family response regulator
VLVAKVLIIEDQTHMRMILKVYLEKMGHHTNEAATLSDAADAAGTGEADFQKNRVLPLAESEKRHMARVLKLTDFNILRTAELLKISRPHLYRKVKEYNLDVDSVID